MPTLDETGLPIPEAGQWPVDPQEDIPIDPQRVWIDGCFDFTHHGHAGAMLQARRLGRELLVGIHSDEAILANKGPTVMNLAERVSAVSACRWSTQPIPHAPYVTSLAWISHYGCRDVVHGDDITSDASGADCYRYVKAAGRFVVVKRTPGISTTDLVGRMLLCTKGHFVGSLEDVLEGREGEGREKGEEMRRRIREYASDETGLKDGVQVWMYRDGESVTEERRYENVFEPAEHTNVKPGQRLVYVDGGFDLFSPGHIAFLESVVETEKKLATDKGWDKDYPPFYLVAGIHDDVVVNQHKGLNYPIMNIFERGLCVLQCKYVNAVIFGTPYAPDEVFLRSSPFTSRSGLCWDVIYHGPAGKDEAYAYAKEQGVFARVGPHAFQDVNANTIVERILASRALFEERQRKKGEKATLEELEKEEQAKARLAAEHSAH